MPSFDNTEIAFKGKSDRDLLWSYRLFRLIGKPWFVSTGSMLTRVAMVLHLPIKGLIKKTIFRQFCGGETISECDKRISDLSHYGIGTILDYSVEGKTDDEGFDKTRDEIIETIKKAKLDASIPFTVFKSTGLARMALLEKTNSSKTALTEEDEIEYEHFFDRVDAICKEACLSDVPVFIDAEDSWIQDGIDRIAEVMMRQYNRKKAIVFSTVQMYRHDRLLFIKDQFYIANESGYFVGVKVVRGAYMEKERERATMRGYPSPIQKDKESTDRDFNLALDFMLARINTFYVCCGTHNEESTDHLLALMNKYKIDRADKRVFAAQLLGMSDHITYNLAHNGYNVAKYVPYGPVKEVIPYLLRRAQENTSVAGQTSRELNLIMTEKERRKLYPVKFA